MKIHNRRRISRQKYTILFNSFVSDIPASKAAKIANVNRKTADRYFNLLRAPVIKAALRERKKANLGNGVEIDESYFGPRRVRGKRGRGAGRKIIVFGLLKRDGNVYTQIIKSAQKDEVMPIIRKVVKSGSDIYSDGWRSYDALAVYGYNHKKVKHDKDEFVKDADTHINGVDLGEKKTLSV
jgi:transposase